MKRKTSRNQWTLIRAALGLAILCLGVSPVAAQTQLLAIEFNEDDQEGFDLWPEPLNQLTSSTATFTTDSSATTGTTTVTVTSSTRLNVPANRGNLTDGSPEGFTLAGLYQDLLHAASPTGFLTLDFSGLNPNQLYQFTLYAWDPGATDASDKVWTVTGGAGDPEVVSVNFQDPLIDNDSFALVFEIMTTVTGTFQVTNTDGLPQSAINGFALAYSGAATPFAITEIVYDGSVPSVDLTFNSRPGRTYAIETSTSLDDGWIELDDGVVSQGEETTYTDTVAAIGERVFYRVKEN